MSGFGKDRDPSKRSTDGAQNDCDSFGNRDHVYQRIEGGSRDQKKQYDLARAVQDSTAQSNEETGGILGPLCNTKSQLVILVAPVLKGRSLP
uniref:Uncharacterized protein n=1 Tax=Physcomitrium patens TaxID=3218 RepID=A0A2K1ICL2_PHYPA|nr:hypothetical protein PHYPA_030488 [Physcomitrium patens]